MEVSAEYVPGVRMVLPVTQTKSILREMPVIWYAPKTRTNPKMRDSHLFKGHFAHAIVVFLPIIPNESNQRELGREPSVGMVGMASGADSTHRVRVGGAASKTRTRSVAR